MTQWVKIRTGDGQHHDSRIGLHVRGTEKKPLPDVVPAGTLTAQRLDMGALIYCDPPEGETEIIEAVPVEEDNAEPDTPGVADEDSAERETGGGSPPPAKKKAGKKKG